MIRSCPSVGKGCILYLLKIHTLHRLIHTFDNIAHTLRHRPHRNSRLHPTAHSIYPARQLKQIQLLILFPDRVLGVNLRDIVVALLDRL